MRKVQAKLTHAVNTVSIPESGQWQQCTTVPEVACKSQIT